MNFLALSQAPPELAEDVAIQTPDTKIPGNNPATAVGPNRSPKMRGAKITKNPGNIISFNDDLVDIAMHLS